MWIHIHNGMFFLNTVCKVNSHFSAEFCRKVRHAALGLLQYMLYFHQVSLDTFIFRSPTSFCLNFPLEQYDKLCVTFLQMVHKTVFPGYLFTSVPLSFHFSDLCWGRLFEQRWGVESADQWRSSYLPVAETPSTQGNSGSWGTRSELA